MSDVGGTGVEVLDGGCSGVAGVADSAAKAGAAVNRPIVRIGEKTAMRFIEVPLS
ncbi:hypothetical protein AB0F91_12670 [Amycolatopsis sp. NPDC023774]|uniref:hypothetical protein n=1 Tax=Amycolatopsis sp. NPDC023774 TaxID=3155015 RepID=UPI0033E84F06